MEASPGHEISRDEMGILGASAPAAGCQASWGDGHLCSGWEVWGQLQPQLLAKVLLMTQVTEGTEIMPQPHLSNISRSDISFLICHPLCRPKNIIRDGENRLSQNLMKSDNNNVSVSAICQTHSTIPRGCRPLDPGKTV